MLRVGVIGCGAAGLCAGRHMVHFPETYDFIIFEQTSEIGGTWNYTEKTGIDEFNLPIQSSMYKNLRTNIPKEIMGYPDFSFPTLGKSFTHHSQVLQYLHDYASFHKLYDKIKLRTHVKSIIPKELPGNKRIWKVIVEELETNVEKEFEFDAILVCNGHFSVPYIPEIENINAFKGLQIHSHSYREPDVYKDKTIIVLGAGSSGMDISMEVSSYAKKVYLSHNNPRYRGRLPSNVIQKPGIKRASEDGFILLDNSYVTADVLMYCTGYLYDFPFLTDECKVRIEDNRVTPLYKHLIHIDFPELAFVGLPFTVLPFPFFHYQVQYFLKTLNKSIKLPDRATMEEESKKEYQRRIVDLKMPPKHAHKMGPLQWEYIEDLSNISMIENLPPVYKALYEEVEEERLTNVMFYKREDYKVLSKEEYIKIMSEP